MSSLELMRSPPFSYSGRCIFGGFLRSGKEGNRGRESNERSEKSEVGVGCWVLGKASLERASEIS